METVRSRRFTLFGAVRLAGLAIARRRSSLLLVLAANVATTAAFAAADKAWFGGPDLAMLAGRLVGKLAFALNDATLGIMLLVLAVEGLKGRAETWGDRWRRVRAAFGPALLLAVLAELSSAALEINAILYFTSQSPSLFEWIILADLVLDVAVAGSIGMAAYAAVESPRGLRFGGALRRSLQLTVRARWRLAWLAIVLWLLTAIVSMVDFGIVGGLTQNPPLRGAVGQGIYTVWYGLIVVMSAGVGAALARPEDDVESLATEFD